MANYRKYQAKTSGGCGGASGVEWHGTQQETPEDARREAHERGGSELGANDSVGSGDGLDDRLERTDVIDPDGVERHGDLMTGMGENGENAPSEANFDETIRVVEAQEAIQVTTDSGGVSGLDNGVDQPGEASTPEEGKPRGPASESGNPQPKTPAASDRACRGSLPATVSRREESQLRDEHERRAVEKMVEDMPTAGNCAPGEILMSALALPLSGGRGP